MTESRRRRSITKAPGSHASLYLCLVVLFGCCLAWQSANGQTPHHGGGAAHGHASSHDPDHKRPNLPGLSAPTSIAIPDITLTDQGNRKVRLFKDLMKGKLVVLNFFYTTCEGICPTSGRWLSKLQDKLGGRLGKEVVILSITIDPEIDTPEKLNGWGGYWKRRAGWTLLTSKGKDLQELMKRFEPYPEKGTHSATVFVGDGTQNPVRWVALDILDEGDFLLHHLRAEAEAAKAPGK